MLNFNTERNIFKGITLATCLTSSVGLLAQEMTSQFPSRNSNNVVQTTVSTEQNLDKTSELTGEVSFTTNQMLEDVISQIVH